MQDVGWLARFAEPRAEMGRSMNCSIRCSISYCEFEVRIYDTVSQQLNPHFLQGVRSPIVGHLKAFSSIEIIEGLNHARLHGLLTLVDPDTGVWFVLANRKTVAGVEHTIVFLAPTTELVIFKTWN